MRELTKIFKALSDSNRLRILKMLEIRALCVCEITEILQLAPSTVSKHLAILRDANLITDSKEGKWVNYALNTADRTDYVADLLPILAGWLPDDSTVETDAQKVRSVDRFKLCGV